MRPKLTYELMRRMCELKADGLSNKDVCRAVGIHEATLYRWLDDDSTELHRAFNEEYKKAEVGFKQSLLNTIRDAAMAKNANWTAAAWLLERSYPDEYGRVDRRREESKAAEVPQIVLGVAAVRVGDAAAEVLSVEAGPAGGGDAAALPPAGEGDGEDKAEGDGSDDDDG